MKKSKWFSRKLLAAVGTTIVGAFCPELLPLLKILAPTYIVAQGIVDAAASMKSAPGE